MSLIAQHVVDHRFDGIGFGTVARAVDQQVGEGGDGVGTAGRGVGVGAGQITIEGDAAEGSLTALEAGQHELARLVLNRSSLDGALHEGLVHVANRTRGGGNRSSHTIVALTANAHLPVQGFSVAQGPLLGEGHHGVAEGGGGAGAVRAVHHADLAGGATHVLPIADGTHEDGHHLLLGELQGATGLVVADGNGAAHGWDLQHTAAHLGLVLGGDGVIGCREAHGFIDESLAAST